MRRLASIALGCALFLAGCGAGETVSPLPKTVEGKLPTTPATKGDPAAGKSLFSAQGCGGCHVYKPAGSGGKVGPGLDNLAADAQKANQGPLDQYVQTSIADPNAYIVAGFPKGVMPVYGGQLSPAQIADLVAFLTQNQKS